MIPTILAVLTILCSVGVNLGDETQQQVHHHKVTGQPTHVTHVHRYTHQQAGQGNGGQTLQGGGGEGTQGTPQQHMRVHRVTGQQVTRVHRVTGALQQHQHQQKTQGPTSSGPSSEIYEVTSEVISGVPTSSEIYEVLSSVISGAPTSSVIYEEISEVISGVPTSSQIYEVLSGSPSSSEIYELLSGSGPAVSQLSEDIYELLSGGPSSGGPSSGGSSVEISQVAKPAILGAKGQTSQVAPELRSNYDASLKNGGYSFEGAFGVNQRRRCDRGLIDRAATGSKFKEI
nr:uncharacterized protein LOC107447057 [Parasteatoda tepidariorum]